MSGRAIAIQLDGKIVVAGVAFGPTRYDFALARYLAGEFPVPAFTYSPSDPVTGSPVSFDASSSTCSTSPCSYRWTDDADSSLLGTDVAMSFTFRDPGTKYVRLTITDAQSRSASVEHDVIVE